MESVEKFSKDSKCGFSSATFYFSETYQLWSWWNRSIGLRYAAQL